MTDPRDRKRESRERAKRDAARSDAITREHHLGMPVGLRGLGCAARLARAEQLKAAIKRRDALKREWARVVARIQAELEAERTFACVTRRWSRASSLALAEARGRAPTATGGPLHRASVGAAVAAADRAHAPRTG